MKHLRDWTGNRKTPFVTIGASGHFKEREERDFYATHPDAVQKLLDREKFISPIWEPAAGMNHITDVLKKNGYDVCASDICVRRDDIEQFDFLGGDYHKESWFGDIITNPPYRFAEKFAKRALEILKERNKMALLLKLTFLEGMSRKKFFECHPPVRIYVFSKRIRCAKNGEFDKYKTSSAMAFAWFVWEKGYKGKPVVDWI